MISYADSAQLSYFPKKHILLISSQNYLMRHLVIASNTQAMQTAVVSRWDGRKHISIIIQLKKSEE